MNPYQLRHRRAEARTARGGMGGGGAPTRRRQEMAPFWRIHPCAVARWSAAVWAPGRGGTAGREKGGPFVSGAGRPWPDWSRERRLAEAGVLRVAGVDEAGRGPLAGPVVAAAVILPVGVRLPGLRDSKLLSPRRRERLLGLIREAAVAWSVCAVLPGEIDRLNIRRAALLAMARAVGRLDPVPDWVLVDGEPIPGLAWRQTGVPRGDALCASIAAASVLAKVYRDRVMDAFDRLYPGYGFARHKGYPTEEHRAALARLGPCPIHRRSFALTEPAVRGRPDRGRRREADQLVESLGSD